MRSLVRPLARAVRDHILPRTMPAPRPERSLGGDAHTVRVVGLLSSATGLGSSARLCARQLQASGYDLALDDVSAMFGLEDNVPLEMEPAAGTNASATIYHLNPPMFLPGVIGSGLPSYYRGFNIGYWAWELETLPDEWVRMLDYVDAVMVPSTFCRDAVAKACDKPICVVPHPVDAAAAPNRSSRGDNVFRVLSVFNFGSSFERKNPLAAVAAFQMAFGDSAQARLILKTSAGERYPQELARLQAATGGARNIEIFDAVLPAQELARFYEDADAYLSLHRSEGYGLPIAEAIMRGCPAIVTSWSGNLDFCTPDTARLVPCTLIPFADNDRAYARVTEGRWADPDVEAAAAHLRQVHEDRVGSRAMAERARAALLLHASTNTYALALRTLCGSGL